MPQAIVAGLMEFLSTFAMKRDRPRREQNLLTWFLSTPCAISRLRPTYFNVYQDCLDKIQKVQVFRVFKPPKQRFSVARYQ